MSAAPTDWKRLRAATAARINTAVAQDPDASPTDKAFWANAEVVMPRSKKTLTTRLDGDLLD